MSANFEPSSYNEYEMLQLEIETSSMLELSLDKERANIELTAEEESITFYNYFFRFVEKCQQLCQIHFIQKRRTQNYVA